MANKKKHLFSKERFCIEKMLGEGESFGKIAHTLGRGVSTVSEEVNENGGRDAYRAERAESRAYWKQYRKKRECNAVAMNSHVQKVVEKKLELRWSPERIAAWLALQKAGADSQSKQRTGEQNYSYASQWLHCTDTYLR